MDNKMIQYKLRNLRERDPKSRVNEHIRFEELQYLYESLYAAQSTLESVIRDVDNVQAIGRQAGRFAHIAQMYLDEWEDKHVPHLTRCTVLGPKEEA